MTEVITIIDAGEDVVVVETSDDASVSVTESSEIVQVLVEDPPQNPRFIVSQTAPPNPEINLVWIQIP